MVKSTERLQIALSVKPDANSYNNCAKMYTRLGNYDQIIEYFSKAITAQPDNDDLETAYNGMAEGAPGATQAPASNRRLHKVHQAWSRKRRSKPPESESA
ncbi:MAG: tetratricopeptide repeat protein [Candidatus Obscuribacterales bacterium]